MLLEPAEYVDVHQLTRAMRLALKDCIRDVPPSDDIQAKRFLEGVAYAARWPAEPLRGCAREPEGTGPPHREPGRGHAAGRSFPLPCRLSLRYASETQRFL